jgi:hypothetical protein
MNDIEREIVGDVVAFKHEIQTAGSEAAIHQQMQQIADQNPPESVQLILRKAEPIGVDLPLDEKSLWQYAIREMTDSAISKARAGFALLTLKERLERGDFMRELKERSIPHSSAKDAMGVAKLLLKLPESKQKLFIGLGATKLNLLARLPDETIEEMAESDLFDGQPVDALKLKSTRELQEEIRRLFDKHERETKVLQEQNNRLIREKAELEAENDTLKGVQADGEDADAERAALIRFSHAKDMVSEAISIITSDLTKASPRLKLEAAFIADFIEANGRHAAVLLRRLYPECWEGADYVPVAEEYEDAQSQLKKAGAKLHRLSDADLK